MTDVPIAAPVVGDAERRGVSDVLDSGQLADGEQVRRFEREFADFVGTENGVATSNGTTALHAALEALEIGDGDAVLTTPFSFVATANAIRLAGATPVFADIDPETYNLDPQAVERVLDERDDVAAILAVHLYGLPAAMAELRDLADEHDASLIEDAAQAHGATYRGEPVGSVGDAACFSFYPTKNMTTGEGGMVTTDDAEVERNLRRFVNHGRDQAGYEHVSVGHNFRMTNLAAAIGRAQLDRLPAFIDARRGNAAALTDLLEDADVTTPRVPTDRTHAFHQYTVDCDDRDALTERLDAAGVGYGVYYPTPIHEQPAYDGVDATAPAAERAARRVLSLPVHPQLSERDVYRVADAVRGVRVDE